MKFCFKNGNGTLNYMIEYPVAYAYINLNLYYDDEWKSVYPNSNLVKYLINKRFQFVENYLNYLELYRKSKKRR